MQPSAYLAGILDVTIPVPCLLREQVTTSLTLHVRKSKPQNSYDLSGQKMIEGLEVESVKF